MRSPALRISMHRLGIVRALLLAAFVALGARAAHLAFDPRGAELGKVQRATLLRIAAERLGVAA